MAGFSAEVEFLDFSSDYTYNGSAVYDYAMTSIELECSSSGKHNIVGSVVFEGRRYARRGIEARVVITYWETHARLSFTMFLAQRDDVGSWTSG